jgi:NADH-quinone oxidoreductase subunit J
VFVITLLGVDKHETFDEPSAYQRPVAIVLGAMLFLQVVVLAWNHWTTGAHSARHKLAGARTGNVETLAKSLFTDFVWAFEITAVLLVIAVVGGVALARRSGQRPGPVPGRDEADTPAGAQGSEP